MTHRLPVVLMWHMHQPQYRDALTGEYVLPWTYLHALKDYSDMAAHLEQNPAARAVVNFTPVLIEQLQEYALRRLEPPAHRRAGARPRARHPGRDRAARRRRTDGSSCSRPAARAPCEHDRALRGLRRDRAAGRVAGDAGAHRLGLRPDDLGPGRLVSPRLARRDGAQRRHARQDLVRQGRGFAPTQRRKLLGLVAEVLDGIVPRYRALAESGRIELSVTPYGHPILPLLYDFGVARESQPGVPLPRHAELPGRRRSRHLAHGRGDRVFTDTFGFAPTGCWPSEGAISADALALIDRFGLRWAATSGNVLQNSIASQHDTQAGARLRPTACPARS